MALEFRLEMLDVSLKALSTCGDANDDGGGDGDDDDDGDNRYNDNDVVKFGNDYLAATP
jgi:hypothetical protein